MNRAVLRRVWRFIAAYHRRVYAFLVTVALSSGIAVLPPLVFRRLIDVAIPAGDLAAINLLAGVALFLALAGAGLSLVSSMLAVGVGEGLIFDLRSALFDHVQRMPIAFFTRTQTGALISRLNNDVIGAQQAVTSTLSTAVSSSLGLAFTLFAMMAMSWQITILCLLLVPVYLGLARRVGRIVQRLARKQMESNARMNSLMTERFNVSGALLVKLFGRLDEEAGEFRRHAAEVRDTGIRRSLVGRSFGLALGTVASVATAAVYLFGARGVVQGSLSVGTMVSLTIYLGRLYGPIQNLTTIRVDVLSALVSFDRVFEVLDAPLAIVERPHPVELKSPNGHIQVRDVWFRYPGSGSGSIPSLEEAGDAQLPSEPSDWILRGVSLSAEPGAMIALVGPSGAGKTTLSNLVARLFDTTYGSILFDGRDIRDVSLQSLADSIGVVSQDPHLFHDSISANLRYAKPSATDAELADACRAARIHDVIAALPEGYDTIVGERGYRMSGGEKQRLAIARVLLKAPAAVILDEATAHLDSENEAAVQRALATALEGRTSIVIAHRLSTIRAASEIIVLDEGRIVQRGTHDELIAADGLYTDLYETQFAPGAGGEVGRAS
ncbi:MAG: ABC transporter ATP-binding protein [Actinobacteria bacterium]|nr:ABC transporter ATP-binding protein [Actinomycetota bacterium]